MRILLVIGASFYLVSCSSGDTFNRGYVISKSQLETEQEAVSPEESTDLH